MSLLLQSHLLLYFTGSTFTSGTKATNTELIITPSHSTPPRPPHIKNMQWTKKNTERFPPLCQHTHCRTFSPITLLLLTLRWDHHGNRPERESRQLTGCSQHGWLLARSPPEHAHTVTNEPRRADAPIG